MSSHLPARKLGLLSAVALGIGGMMGAGLYTLIGLAATTAGPWVPVAFLIAGFAASFSVYSYAKMGSAFPSSGGAASFINAQFGRSVVSGGVNIFQYISYLIATALYAAGFADYVGALMGAEAPQWMLKLIGPAVVAVFAVINILGSSLVGKAETYIIIVEVVILVVFLIYGLFHANPSAFLASDHQGSLLGIVTASGLLYVTYQGFGVIANASSEMANPGKQVPQAMFISLVVVAIIYLAVSTLTMFLLPDASLTKDSGHVLADAGQVLAGRLGFVVISIAAIAATASAVNATIFASANVGEYLARVKQAPKFFGNKLGGKVPVSLLISAAVIMVLVFVFPLSAVGQMTSLAFLLIYGVVSWGHLKVRAQTGAKAWPLYTAIIINAIMFVVLLFDAITTGPIAAWITLIVAIVGSFIYAWQVAGRKNRRQAVSLDPT
jgi:amino acid transporter